MALSSASGDGVIGGSIGGGGYGGGGGGGGDANSLTNCEGSMVTEVMRSEVSDEN